MGFSLLRRYLHDRSGATITEYVLLTAAASALAAVVLSFSAAFTAERADVIQRLLISPDTTGLFEFKEK